MDIGAIGKMLGMARGHESLNQEPAPQRSNRDAELLRKLQEMLLGSGSAGSDGSAMQMDPDEIRKMLAGRQGMEAMMPESDNGRKVGA